MSKKASPLKLKRGDKKRLESITRKRTAAARDVQRSRLILLALHRYSNAEIARLTDMQRHRVLYWRKRYEKEGLAGLEDRQRPGRPKEISVAAQKKLVTKVCGSPPKGYSRWSIRLLSEKTNMAFATVQRILNEYDLHPHRIVSFTISPDPNFEDKLLDVVGLYMKPPENALVLCVDEKTGIQALDRTQPMLPLRSKKPRCWTNEYVRHGTRTMIASLDVNTGEVISHVKDNRRSETFLKFLDCLVNKYKGKRLCIIMDNLNTHKNAVALEWLDAHPNVSFHYTPTHASWVNMIEVFFSIMTRQGLQQSVHKSARELERFLKEYVKEYNKKCGPYIWTKGPKKLKRIIQLTKEYQKTQIN